MKCVYLALLLMVLSGCIRESAALGSAENPIKFMFVPSVESKVLQHNADALKKYLEANTPYHFTIAIPQNYVAVVEAFGTKRADVASLNTFGYILAHDKYGVEARLLVVRFGEDTYRGAIMARADGPVKTIEDIKGRKFAFVDPASTSGYLLPAKLLKDRGIAPSQTVFAQKHDNVVTMLLQKQVDAGATYYSAPQNGQIQDARRLLKAHVPDIEQKIKIIELTPKVPNDPFVFRKDLPSEIKTTITAALQQYVLTEEGKKNLYESHGITGVKPVTDDVYNEVRELLKALGKEAASLVK